MKLYKRPGTKRKRARKSTYKENIKKNGKQCHVIQLHEMYTRTQGGI